MNGVNPHAYLKATLEAIANGHPDVPPSSVALRFRVRG